MKTTLKQLILLTALTSTISYAAPHQIGDYYQGGVIYWLDATKANHHGLIVNTNDAPLSSDYSWDTNPPSKTEATEATPYSGKTNTKLIISQIGSTRAQASAACVNNTNQGYSDWYLPAKNELAILLTKQKEVTKTLEAHEGHPISNSPYWSSTEYGDNSAWNVSHVLSGGIHEATYKKNITLHVRCVREF